jgi:hypothetical protein
MKVAILSAGPSLKRTWRGNDQYMFTIAVNHALSAERTDWLAAGDAPTLVQLGARRPFIGVWTMRHIAEAGVPGWENVRMIPFNDMPGWVGLSRPANWSIQAALAGAYGLGATSVDVYGHDMAGTLDVSGRDGEDRSAERWERERADWQSSCDYMLARGITIRRIIDTQGTAHA